VYMLSSVGDNLNISTDYSQLGLTGVLQKPINPHLLLSTLKAKLKPPSWIQAPGMMAARRQNVFQDGS